MPAPNNPSPTVGEAVRAWCVAHPLLPHDRKRRCPACLRAGCYRVMPDTDGVLRWACFSSHHARSGVGVAGRGCWHGDALDLEAHRRGASRVDVLRADGYLAGPALRVAPVVRRPSPRVDDPFARWATLRPSGDAFDLVRLDVDGRAVVRAYGLSGRPIGVRPVEALPSGWYGATPRAAADVLRDGRPGRWATPAALLAGEAEPGDDLVIAQDVAPALAVRASASFSPAVARVLDVFGGSVEQLEEVSRG
jgi:hypothetical protein